MNNTRAINRRFFRQAFLGLAAVMTVALVACGGTPGPAGPAGASGANGATGATGPQGPAGPSGGSNVLYSDWIDINWTRVATREFRYTYTATKITQAVINQGAILFYLRVRTTPNIVYENPYVLIQQNNSIFHTSSIAVTAYLSGFEVYFSSTDPIFETVPIGNVHSVRYVIFPPGTAIQSLSTKSYAEIAKKFNTQD
jgi:hypothetical protein